MSKRRLSQQQTNRINQQHTQRVQRVRKDKDIDTNNLSAPQKGLIIAHYGSQLEVKSIEGENEGEIWRCHLRSNLEALVTGDEVMWQADNTNKIGVVTALMPRLSLLTRLPGLHCASGCRCATPRW